jgi:hypothetical protein
MWISRYNGSHACASQRITLYKYFRSNLSVKNGIAESGIKVTARGREESDLVPRFRRAGCQKYECTRNAEVTARKGTRCQETVIRDLGI